jgi:hypothetical protein
MVMTNSEKSNEKEKIAQTYSDVIILIIKVDKNNQPHDIMDKVSSKSKAP